MNRDMTAIHEGMKSAIKDIKDIYRLLDPEAAGGKPSECRISRMLNGIEPMTAEVELGIVACLLLIDKERSNENRRVGSKS